MSRAMVVLGPLLVLAPATAAAGHHYCREVSRVMGRTACRQFGDWSLITRFPAMTGELDLVARSISIAAPPSGTAARTSEPVTPDRRVQAQGVAMRFTIGARPFVGLEVEIGHATDGGYAEFGIPIGYRGRTGRWLLGVEAVPAIRLIVVGQLPSSPLDGSGPVLEARVRVERLLSPWWSVGAFAGADVTGPGGWMMGLAFTGHARAFDAL